MAFGIHAPDPNHKPTAQLFDLAGNPVGFAKLGWNQATRELVRNEADALEYLASHPEDSIEVPRLLHRGAWNDLYLSVSAPLPMNVRAHHAPDRPPPVEITRAIAERHGLRNHLLVDCSSWARLGAGIDAVRDEGRHPLLAHQLRSFADRVAAAHGDKDVCCGAWHGDWVPWNLGWSKKSLHVWDWEHSSVDVPMGFDLLHWTFQVAFVLRQRPLDEAAAAVDVKGTRLLAQLGVPPKTQRLLTSLYLLEIFVRAHRLMQHGSGWNPRLYPAMLDVLARRAP